MCIEPSPENLPELRTNIARNRIQNVTLHEVAIGDVPGRRGVRPGINGGFVEGDASIGDVDIVRLDELLDEPVDVIKIDVDGFEGQVLEGSRRLIERDRPVILLEVHPHLIARYGFSCRMLHQFLQEHYSRIEAFELPRPSTMTLYAKLVDRYSSGGVLKPVLDVDGLAADGDCGRHDYTYWLLCRP